MLETATKGLCDILPRIQYSSMEEICDVELTTGYKTPMSMMSSSCAGNNSTNSRAGVENRNKIC